MLLFPALIPACQSPETDADQPWKQNGKLQVSDNGHFLEHENGVPFLWLGGTVWGMTEWMTREEVDLYLDNRKEKGFSVIQVCLAWGKREEDPVQFHVNPVNAYGHKAFLYSDSLPDPSRPHTVAGGSPEEANDYWDHVDYVIEAAAKRGIYVGVLPVWGRRYVNATHPGFSERLFDLENSKDYGKFLGERYKAAPNIIWVLGGDVSADAGGDFTLVYRTMAEGIIQGITGKKANWNQADPIWDMALITYHPDGNPTKNSSSWFHTDPWLDFNMIETHIYRDSLSKAVLRDYQRKDPYKPVVLAEGHYEGYTRKQYAGAIHIRRQAYQSFFACGAGHTYGAARDSLNRGPLFSPYDGWQSLLDLDGAKCFPILKKFLTDQQWFTWIPDDSVLPQEPECSEFTKTAVSAHEGHNILVYFPDRSPALVNLASLGEAKNLNISWFNPVTGIEIEAQSIAIRTLLTIYPPPGWEDAVAILKAEK